MPHIYDKATGLCLVCDRAEIAAIREADLILSNNNRNGKKSQQAIHPTVNPNQQPPQISQQSNRQNKTSPPPPLPIPPPSNRSTRRSKPVITHYTLPQEYDPPDLYDRVSRSRATPRPILKHISPSRLANNSSYFGPTGGDLVRSNGNLYYYNEDFGDHSPSPVNYVPSYRDQPSRYYQYAADGSSPTHQVQYVTKAPKKNYFLPIDTFETTEDDDRIQYIINNSPRTRKKIMVHHHYE